MILLLASAWFCRASRKAWRNKGDINQCAVSSGTPGGCNPSSSWAPHALTQVYARYRSPGSPAPSSHTSAISVLRMVPKKKGFSHRDCTSGMGALLRATLTATNSKGKQVRAQSVRSTKPYNGDSREEKKNQVHTIYKNLPARGCSCCPPVHRVNSE